MLCPTDQTVLVMTERKGVEIDYCPTCRGVWLDRGELDKIIDRSVEGEIAAEAAGPAAARAARTRRTGPDVVPAGRGRGLRQPRPALRGAVRRPPRRRP